MDSGPGPSCRRAKTTPSRYYRYGEVGVSSFCGLNPRFFRPHVLYDGNVIFPECTEFKVVVVVVVAVVAVAENSKVSIVYPGPLGDPTWPLMTTASDFTSVV